MTINDAQNATLEAYKNQIISGDTKKAQKTIDLYKQLRELEQPTNTPNSTTEPEPISGNDCVISGNEVGNEKPISGNEIGNPEETEVLEPETASEPIPQDKTPISGNEEVISGNDPETDEWIENVIEDVFSEELASTDPIDVEFCEAVREFTEKESVSSSEVKAFINRAFPDGLIIDDRNLAYDYKNQIKNGSVLAWPDPNKRNGAMRICPRSVVLLTQGVKDPRIKPK